MKIAHFPSSFFPTVGGAEISVYNIATTQSKMNNQVTLILYPHSYRYFKNFKIKYAFKIDHFFPLTRFSYNLLNSIGLKPHCIIDYQINRIQQKHNFDVWHFSLLDSLSLIAIEALKKYNIKIIATFRGSDIQKVEEINYGQRLDKKYESALINVLSKIDHFTAISQSVVDEYEKLQINKKRISLIPNGIDFERFDSIRRDNGSLQKYFNVDQNKKVILTVGRNHPKKGFNNIEKIIDSLKTIRKDFIWVIVGQGTEKIVDDLKDRKNIKYLKTHTLGEIPTNILEYPQDELIKIYKSSNLFVFPTLIETLGNVQIEAMVSGIPVISSNVEGCRNIIDNNENGILCDPLDFNAFAKSIDLLLSNKSLRKKLMGNARNRIKMLNIENIVNKYLELYNN